jgi:hypothetical protein
MWFLIALAAFFADVIITVDGRQLEGSIIEETESAVTIRLPQGELSIPRERIERIIRKASPLDDYTKRAGEAKTADEHYALGQWCLEKGMNEQAKEEFAKAVALEPDHKGAREALAVLSKKEMPPKRDEPKEKLWKVSKDEETGKKLKEQNKIPEGFVVWRVEEFLLATDVEEKKIPEYGALLGKLLENMRKTYTGLFKKQNKEPMLVLLFNSRDDYRRFTESDGVPEGKDAYGYYSGKKRKAYLFELAQATRKFILHECTHQIYAERMIGESGAKTSPWLFEGMAEYSEGAAVKEEFKWGRTHDENLWVVQNAIKQKKAFELRRLLSATKFEELFNSNYESEECQIAYAESWALFYFLMEKQKDNLIDYIRSEKNGEGGIARFEQLFGNVESIETAFEKFILSVTSP